MKRVSLTSDSLYDMAAGSSENFGFICQTKRRYMPQN
jgi:hypothetical protein